MKLRYIIVFLFIFVPAAHSGQTMKEIMTPPADSADLENLRIWVPVERKSSCRMTVDIMNSNGEVIRHLVDALVPPGYYNFYWDKRNDSGRYAFVGEYKYHIEDCVTKDSGKLVVDYKPEEIKTSIVLVSLAKMEMKLPEDSVRIRIEWRNKKDSLVIIPIDSVLGPGKHNIVLLDDNNESMTNYEKASNISAGIYEQVVIMDGIVFDRKDFVYMK